MANSVGAAPCAALHPQPGAPTATRTAAKQQPAALGERLQTALNQHRCPHCCSACELQGAPSAAGPEPTYALPSAGEASAARSPQPARSPPLCSSAVAPSPPAPCLAGEGGRPSRTNPFDCFLLFLGLSLHKVNICNACSRRFLPAGRDAALTNRAPFGCSVSPLPAAGHSTLLCCSHRCCPSSAVPTCTVLPV